MVIQLMIIHHTEEIQVVLVVEHILMRHLPIVLNLHLLQVDRGYQVKDILEEEIHSTIQEPDMLKTEVAAAVPVQQVKEHLLMETILLLVLIGMLEMVVMDFKCQNFHLVIYFLQELFLMQIFQQTLGVVLMDTLLAVAAVVLHHQDLATVEKVV